MSQALVIRAIGNSSGVVLPKDLLDQLGLAQGDKVFVTKIPDGITLRAFDPTFAMQMEVARRVMKKRRAVLRELAK